MSIRLEILPHQEEALETIETVLNDVKVSYNENSFENPTIDTEDSQIEKNIKYIWNQSYQLTGLPKIPQTMRKAYKEDNPLGIDIKMETGTGKTYVYTRLMYELRKFGFFKFIILVPSTPIKEGTRNFIESDYAKDHFNDLFPNINLELNVLDPQKNTKKGRKMIPTAISNFAKGSRLEKNKINALLTTSSMLMSKATMAKDDYDQTLLGEFTQPYEALRNTKPIVIIDEPHRFKRENVAYKTIIDELDPQMIFRFGATFPDLPKNQGKDYNNLIYNLGAARAFNEGLVKGVAHQTIENIDEEDGKIKFTSWEGRGSKKILSFRDEKTNKTQKLKINDDLGIISPSFSGITIDKIGKTDDENISSGVTLSNGMILTPKDIIYSSVYSETYQDMMIQQAIKNHFKIEWQNFNRNEKIKTLSLFFIDSIYSFRAEDSKPGSLRLKFEKYLLIDLDKIIDKLVNKKTKTKREEEYLSYLYATKNNIEYASGGYFAEDNSTKDEDIKEEVEEILRDKQKLLSFKNDDGSWNIRRFIFSKWTLKEGWDNPNVFQIVKLRSSGSETSKLQEVGRGLRLPVDEYGNRISDEQFYLTYLIDFSEVDFAKNLVNEINDAEGSNLNVRELILDVAEKRNINPDELAMKLMKDGYIDTDKNIYLENIDKFYSEYPEFNQGIKPGIIIDSTSKKEVVNIRKDRFQMIKLLWETINHKYYLKLEDTPDEELIKVIEDIFSNDEDSIFETNRVNVWESRTRNNPVGEVVLDKGITDSYEIYESIPYNEFLKRINKNTGLPLPIIHQGIVNFSRKDTLPKNFLNNKVADNFINKFKDWYIHAYNSHYSYERLNIDRKETALTDVNGQVKDYIIQGNLGIYKDESLKTPESFLYDTVIFDSPKEKQTIVSSGDSNLSDAVIAFGKIPRQSIQVPLYFGGTTSPDFMYLLKDGDDYRLGLIIETKDVDKDEDLRGVEKHKISAAKKFFETMKADGINVEFKKQFKRDQVYTMIEGLFKDNI